MARANVLRRLARPRGKAELGPYRSILRPLPTGLSVLIRTDAEKASSKRGESLRWQFAGNAVVVDPKTGLVLAVIQNDDEARAVYSVRLPKNSVTTPAGDVINLATRRRVDRVTGLDDGPVLSEETVQDYVASKYRPETPLEQRFTRFSSVLTRRPEIVVKTVPNAAFPSCWIPRDKVIQIHENYFNIHEDSLRFILQKGGLFHEDAHVLFTRHSKYREELAKKSGNESFYYTISNFLEDGRIERLFRRTFRGVEPYLRAKAAQFGRDKALKTSPLNDLKFRLYMGRYLTEEAKKLFTPHEALIEQAINSASSKTVWDIALKLTQALSSKMPTPAPTRCAPVKANLSGQPQQTQEGEGEGEGDESEQGEGEPGDQQGGDAGDSGAEPGDEEGEDESEAPGGAGADDMEPIEFDPTRSPDDIVDQIERGVGQKVSADVKRELEELSSEDFKRSVAKQELLEGEDAEARLLSETLRRWRVEAKREKFKTVRIAGSLDPRRLVQVRTEDSCLRSRITPGRFDFDSVLIGDDSGSMNAVMKDEFSVLRVLTAALRDAGFQTKPYFLNAGFLETVPLDPQSIGGTPIEEALDASRQFLATGRARRKVIFLVTDGEPDDFDKAVSESHEARSEGASIIGVGMGGVNPGQMDLLCDRWVEVQSGAELKEVLPELLMEFAAEEVR